MSSRISSAVLFLLLVAAATPLLGAEPSAELALKGWVPTPVVAQDSVGGILPTPRGNGQKLFSATPVADFLFAAADGRTGKTGRGNSMKPTGSTGNLCEEFIITCNGGGGDYCCGSVGSCLNYCEEICGPPCVYNEQ